MRTTGKPGRSSRVSCVTVWEPGVSSSSSVARLSHDTDVESPTERGRTEPAFFDVPAATFSGGYGAFQHLERARESIRGSIATGGARHDLKLGVEYEINRYDEVSDASASPGSPQGFMTKIDDTTYYWAHQQTVLSVKNRVPTVYLQDSWQMADNLTLNLGLRWDAQYLTAANGQSAQSLTGEWQPRVGAIYRLGAHGGHKLFGSFGRFYEQIPLRLSVFYYNNKSTNVVLQFDHDPRLDPSGGDTLSAIGVFNPVIEPRRDLNGQQYDGSSRSATKPRSAAPFGLVCEAWRAGSGGPSRMPSIPAPARSNWVTPAGPISHSRRRRAATTPHW